MTESTVSYTTNAAREMYERVAEQHLGFVPNIRTLNRVLYSRDRDYENPTAYKDQRNYALVLGYNEQPTVTDFRRYYNRTVAKTIVDQPPRDTWKRPPVISEDGKEETLFAKAWVELTKELRVFHYLAQADKVSRVGEFGILLMGFNGGEELDVPVKSASKLLYLRAHSQETVKVEEGNIDENTGSERFGLPVLYTVDLTDEKPGVKVHWTRVLHLAEDKFDSEIFGIPPLLPCLNLLDDLIKLIGGGAEAAWLNMRPGMVLSNQQGYQIPDDDDTKDALRNQLEEYLMGTARIISATGIQANFIPPSVADLSPQISSTLDLVAMVTRIPKRVLLGSAAGELSSASEDTKQWFGLVADRQKTYAEPEILRPFVDRLIRFGILPTPVNGYDVGKQDQNGQWHWPVLYEQSELELAEIESQRTTAAQSTAGAEGKGVLTDKELRVLLRHPAEPEPKMVDPEPEPTPETAPGQIQGPPERPTEAMRQVAANLLTGAIDETAFVEYVVNAEGDIKGPTKAELAVLEAERRDNEASTSNQTPV